MKSNPRIMVFKLKELIYTSIFIVLGILLIILMICMFKSKDDGSDNSSAGEITTQQGGFNASIQSTSQAPTIASNTETQVPTVSADAPTQMPTEANISPTSTTITPTVESTAPTTSSMTETTKSPGIVSNDTYIPGVYTSSLTLNNSSVEIEVCVDKNHINSVSLKNMDESITTMYPLMKSSIEDISNQVVSSQSLENITYTDDCKYTYLILIDAIKTTLGKATP